MLGKYNKIKRQEAQNERVLLCFYLIKITQTEFAIAAFFYEFTVVGNYDYRFSLVLEAAKNFSDLQHVGVVQSAGWFIKKHDVAAACYGTCNCNTLLLSAGK